MRLTTMFLLATLALLGNLKNGFAQRYNQRGTFTVDFFAGIPSCPEVGGQRGGAALRPFLEGTPHALPHVCFQNLTDEFAPGELVNNLRGSVTANFFNDTQIDGQINAAWKSGGDAGFQFRNGFLKIEAAGDTEATFTLETTTDNFKMGDVEANKEAFSTSPGDTV